ncbi:MAG: alpha/beta hydrolase [Hyphomonadaceae bacterium]|jgi:acetyl esterase/lipase|nr:alpha/beta hydrolase [Hyphomonadaceae bacterium]
MTGRRSQRAIRVVRSRAAQDGTRPASVLVLGFSAGGHLAGSLAARFDSVLHQPADPIDQLDARPDLGALMYPVVTMSPPHAHRRSRDNLLGPAPSPEQIAGASLGVNVRASQPPTLLIHAADDPAVPVDHTLMLAGALRSASVPVALHVYERGGHGFGLRGIAGTPLERWPDLLLDWAVSHGFPAPLPAEP